MRCLSTPFQRTTLPTLPTSFGPRVGATISRRSPDAAIEVRAASSHPAHGQRVFSERALLLHFASCLLFRIAGPCGTGVTSSLLKECFGSLISWSTSFPFGCVVGLCSVRATTSSWIRFSADSRAEVCKRPLSPTEGDEGGWPWRHDTRWLFCLPGLVLYSSVDSLCRV